MADQRALRQSFPSADDRSASSSIFRSRLTRGTAEDGPDGRAKRQWNSVDSTASGTILGNLWKRKVANSPSKPKAFQTGGTSGSSLSHRTRRETAENKLNGRDDPKVRAIRQGYMSNGYSLIQWVPGGSLSSSSSTTILNNLWKKRQALYYADVPTFTNL